MFYQFIVFKFSRNIFQLKYDHASMLVVVRKVLLDFNYNVEIEPFRKS